MTSGKYWLNGVLDLLHLTFSQAIFEPFLKSFYVLSTDPTHIKRLKLEVLTNVASETNVHTVLREFRVSGG